LTASYPFTPKIKAVLTIGYQPSLDVEENPVTSGLSPAADGYSVGLTGSYKVSDSVMLALGYFYQVYNASFSGTGTRGVGTTNAEIRDIYQNVNLSLVYEF
jgi:long-subunit fatty acid transport protein